jgi:hypothetical protein
MAVIKAGDVFEIRTPAGTAYFQATRFDPSQGHLIRVLPGTFVARPDLTSLAAGGERFWLYFPLGAAWRRKIVNRVSNEPIPPSARALPLMRSPGRVEHGRVASWAIMDGDTILRWVGALSDAERDLSIAGLWNDTLLVERIASGWAPRDWS